MEGHGEDCPGFGHDYRCAKDEVVFLCGQVVGEEVPGGVISLSVV